MKTESNTMLWKKFWKQSFTTFSPMRNEYLHLINNSNANAASE